MAINHTTTDPYNAPKMIITNNGYVGIGRTDPTNIFQVGSGNKLRIANNNTDYTIIGAGEGPELYTRIVLFGINSTDPGFGGTGNILYLSGNGGKQIFFTQTLSSTEERMRIGNNGNIAIGTRDTTTYKLNVNGTINATSVLVGGSPISGSKWTNNTEDATKIYYNGGNVGIGNTNPQGRLHIGTDAVTNSGYGEIVIGINNGSGSRTTKMGWDSEFYYNLCGDYVSGGQNVWATKQIRCHWTAPTNSLVIYPNGGISIPFGINIGAINDGGNIAKLWVYASDINGCSANFKHPNNSQGIGIAYDGLVALGFNDNQDIVMRPRGTGMFQVTGSTFSQTINGGYYGTEDI
jgi:hypothetical protein